MKILLAQNMVYLPTWGGANKSNRLLLEGLAERGHACHVIAPAHGTHACQSRDLFLEELRTRNIPSKVTRSGRDAFEFRGVHVTAIRKQGDMVPSMMEEIDNFRPDWILVASEDPGQVLLAAAVRADRSRVVYLARTTLALPFGPAAPFDSSVRTELLRQAAGVVAVSEYIRTYFRKWAQMESARLPICPNGAGPFPRMGSFDSGFITIVNPCAYKGIAIFEELAKGFPEAAFAAVPTWGTTRADLDRLRALANVTILTPSDDIDAIFAATKILLVPSLWAEAKANMITEAMLRGIPVLASDVGGNKEAMLGNSYLLPVNAIVEYDQNLDQQLLPRARVPIQDLTPWLDALSELTENAAVYERVATASQSSAIAANEEEASLPIEKYLMDLLETKKQVQSVMQDRD